MLSAATAVPKHVHTALLTATVLAKKFPVIYVAIGLSLA